MNPMTVRIAPIEPQWFEQKAQVQSRAWRALTQGNIPQEIVDAITPEFALTLTRAHADDPDQVTLIALDGDQVVGFAELLRTPRQPIDRPDAAELASLYVAPDRHRRGIGRALVEAGKRAIGNDRLALWVNGFNTNARDFYRHIGFHETGITQTEDVGTEFEMIDYDADHDGEASGRRALIVVDVQPTFCEGGELGVAGGNRIAQRIASYVQTHRAGYAYMATTQDWHIEPGAHWSDSPDYVDTWPVHGKAGTSNAELHPAIAALGIVHHFKKGQYAAAYSGFEGIEDNTDRIQSRDEVAAAQSEGRTLANALKAADISQVDVIGIAESHCVKETAIDAVKLGFRVTVFEDLTVPVSEELGVAARREMAAAGIALLHSDILPR